MDYEQYYHDNMESEFFEDRYSNLKPFTKKTLEECIFCLEDTLDHVNESWYVCPYIYYNSVMGYFENNLAFLEEKINDYDPKYLLDYERYMIRLKRIRKGIEILMSDMKNCYKEYQNFIARFH